MLSKIKKAILILLMIFFLTGCCDIENTNPHQPIIENEEEKECKYKYTYSCGFDAISGSTKCGYGYYYICS